MIVVIVSQLVVEITPVQDFNVSFYLKELPFYSFQPMWAKITYHTQEKVPELNYQWIPPDGEQQTYKKLITLGENSKAFFTYTNQNVSNWNIFSNIGKFKSFSSFFLKVSSYNPYFALKYDAHINVQIVCTVKSVKYLYKYVYKGDKVVYLYFLLSFFFLKNQTLNNFRWQSL